MKMAARTLGYVIERGGPDCFDDIFIRHQTLDALELLKTDNEDRRCASLLILEKLAKHSQSYFDPHIPLVVRSLYTPLRDPSESVNLAAADVLAQVIANVAKSDGASESPTLHELLREPQAGLASKSIASIHGSLIIYRMLFLHSGMVIYTNPRG